MRIIGQPIHRQGLPASCSPSLTLSLYRNFAFLKGAERVFGRSTLPVGENTNPSTRCVLSSHGSVRFQTLHGFLKTGARGSKLVNQER